MVGELDGSETRAYLLIRGLFKRATLNYADPIAGPEYYVAVQVHQQRTPIMHTEISEDGQVHIAADIFLEGNIVAISSGLVYENSEKLPLLEEAINQKFDTKCQEVIQRSQQEFQADIFGFGFWTKHHFLTSSQWTEFGWFEKYPEAQVNVKVHTTIKRTSLQLKTSPYVGGM